MSEETTEYGLVDPFETDNGELDGINPGECFALGVEWAMFRARIAKGHTFTDLRLANNAVRIAAMVERRSRFVEWHPCDTPGWAVITVGGVK